MKVLPIPLNEDNFGYIIIDETTKEGIIVDVSSQPQILINELKRLNVKLVKVLTTHKHWDHAGGNDDIRAAFPSVDIIGSTFDNVEGCTIFANDLDIINLTQRIQVKCLLTPGHTIGHMCYLVTCPTSTDVKQAVFTGDCLFIGGCGKFFEGTAADMFPSLRRLFELDEDTLVYCGHEYTTSNYRFALSIDSTNQSLIQANIRALERRKDNFPTVPSTIRLERETNLFLRCCNSSTNWSNILSSEVCAECRDSTAVLGYLRQLKNDFR